MKITKTELESYMINYASYMRYADETFSNRVREENLQAAKKIVNKLWGRIK